jgi:hypothetical protein
MLELPFATHLAVESVRRQFDPTAPPEPDRPRRSFRPVHHARAATAAVLHRAAEALAPAPERTPAH